jgi:cyclophilin family peptidyl-prolyl cis-trans isomerase
VVFIAACGAFGQESIQAPEVTPTVSSANADIESGCWRAAQRQPAGGGGETGTMKQWSSPPEMILEDNVSYEAVLQTNKGTFTIDLDKGAAPKAVNNFVCLAKAGYFDNTPFHRIVQGFVIQGGDPTGMGSGGPGYRFDDEPVTGDYVKGTVAMANAGPNTNGSQFFVVLDDLRGQLQKNYTIFGSVGEGMEVVDEIASTPTRANERGERSVPTEDVILQQVTINESQ